jgi:hypothetical protein
MVVLSCRRTHGCLGTLRYRPARRSRMWSSGSGALPPPTVDHDTTALTRFGSHCTATPTSPSPGPFMPHCGRCPFHNTMSAWFSSQKTVWWAKCTRQCLTPASFIPSDTHCIPPQHIVILQLHAVISIAPIPKSSQFLHGH